MHAATIYTLISVILVSLVSVIGVTTFLYQKNVQKTLLVLVSLSAGTLFGGAFLHLLPEAVGEGGMSLQVSLLLVAGVLLFFILEKAIHWHHCHLPEYTEEELRKHQHNHPQKKEKPLHIAPLNLIGDGLHNFLDGLILAGSYMISVPTGIATTVAVILHEVPQEIADFGVLLYSGLSRAKALFYNFLSAGVAIVGAIVGLVMGAKSGAFIEIIVPLAAGGFVYVAGSNLIPELHKECRLQESVWHIGALIFGVALMVGLKFLDVA